MKLSGILAILLTGQVALASLFFQDSKSDRVRKHLEGLGFEVVDSAGNFKDSVLEGLSPEHIHAWLDYHGVTEIGDNVVETAKKHKNLFLKDVKEYAESTSEKASDLLEKGKEFYESETASISNTIGSKWSESRLKEFLDARGFKVPQGSTRDELSAAVARIKHKLPINFNGPSGKFWFDGWSRDELVKKLQAAGESIEGSRKQLVDRLHASYQKSYEEGKAQGEESAEKVKTAYGDFREATHETFSKWSVEDLKEYLSDFGAELSEGKDHLVKAAREHYESFVSGGKPPSTIDHLKAHFSNVGSKIRTYLSKVVGLNAVVRSDL